MRRRSFRDFISRVQSAQNRIWITNAYLAPSTPLLRALAKAAQRGVDVKILVPRKSDVFFMPWVTAAHYPKLLKSGIQVFEYIPSFLHAKVALIDDWAIVGSSNLNRRSLIHDHEVDVVVSKPSSIQNLEERFMKDLTQSEQIQKAPLSLAAKFGKFLSWLLKKWI
jgi:cardiolipin synthase